MKIENLVRKNIAEIVPYSASRDECTLSSKILLDANENPYDSGFNRYPDIYSTRLKRVFSGIIDVSPRNLFAGNGKWKANRTETEKFVVILRDYETWRTYY